MKRSAFILATALSILVLGSAGCKSMAKAAAKHWAKKKQKEFVAKCNNMTAKKPGINSVEFCDCVIDIVMEAYPNPDEGMQINLLQLMDLGRDCIKKKP